MNCQPLTQTLVESFSALADEVQSLIDRKTILEHKLKYAHEQYQYLADKYAPAVPEISETLANLQLPPELQSLPPAAYPVVPLPKRGPFVDTRYQVALLIQEGRRAAHQLSNMMASASKVSSSSKNTSLVSPGLATMTAASTVLEQDFTVEGKQGSLACPFSAPKREGSRGFTDDVDGAFDASSVDRRAAGGEARATADSTPHLSSDPICAAMYEQTTMAPASPTNGSPAKCPIRFLDQHSPEEIAHYVETHKHEIPRSHEICVRRYQRSEEQIRKLDAKYGNLASMIRDLSQLHKPMLPGAAVNEDGHPVGAMMDKASDKASDKGAGEMHRTSDAEADEMDKASETRVANWAKAITTDDPDLDSEAPLTDEDRRSHFDRPLRDVRVGESPSRPWGISVPMYAASGQPQHEHPESPPPVPVRMPSPSHSSPHAREDAGDEEAVKPARKTCPFGHGRRASPPPFVKREETSIHHGPVGGNPAPAPGRPSTPLKSRVRPPSPLRPVFVNSSELPLPKAENRNAPQTVFNISGPVFIGYPMKEAMQFMQQFQAQR